MEQKELYAPTGLGAKKKRLAGILTEYEGMKKHMAGLLAQAFILKREIDTESPK